VVRQAHHGPQEAPQEGRGQGGPGTLQGCQEDTEGILIDGQGDDVFYLSLIH
jgi:hypothetical protein